MPGDLDSGNAPKTYLNRPRRQNTNCDPCRRLKRRCVVPLSSHGVPDAICTNCKRLKRQCTFDFAIAQASYQTKKRKERQKRQIVNDQRPPTQTGSSNVHFDNTTLEVAGSPSDQFDGSSLADQDILAAWLNLDYDNILADSVTSISASHEQHNILTTPYSDHSPPEASQPEGQLTPATGQWSRLAGVQNHGLNHLSPTIGLSFNSPIYLLNSGIDAKIFGDRLSRIYDAIATASASRFLDYDCNLYATGNRYSLADSQSRSCTESTSVKSSMGLNAGPSRYLDPVSAQEGINQEISLLGSVRFLDHLSGLYGNRLNSAERKKSDEVFKAVLRVFSMQWLPGLSSFEPISIWDQFARDANSGGVECDSVDAFIDAWARARSLLNDAHHVQSFRVVFATLMFVGIVKPIKIIDREGDGPNDFLDTALRKLKYLDGLVTQYCANLGPSSSYGALAEASLSIVRWTGYIRDTGAALTMDHQCKLPDLWGATKVLSQKDALATLAATQNVLELETNTQSVCRKASAEVFCIWRQIITIKSAAHQKGTVTERSVLTIKAIDSSVTLVRNFSESFQPFILHCIKNFEHLSTCPRISLVSLVMFWNLGIFFLAEIFTIVTKDLDPAAEDATGLIVREYQRSAALCVTQVVECVLNLPAQETFNLQNGLGAEVPLTAYHITPSLAVTALQKAIESVIDLQIQSTCDAAVSGQDAGYLMPDGTWDRQIDILMKALMSLDVTIGGSQTCAVATKALMHKYGDIVSECWTADFNS